MIRIIVLAVFLIFAGRLAYLQILEGANWRRTSERNTTRWIREPATRGRIVDRRGRTLATSVPVHSVWLVSGEIHAYEWASLRTRLVGLGVFPDEETARNALAPLASAPSYLPVRLRSALTLAEVTRLEEALPFLPGIYLKDEKMRSYPEASLAAHVLGFVREIDARALEKRKHAGYRSGDLIGKDGVEKSFEDTLRGIEGSEQIEVDAFGRVLQTLQRVPPTEGRTLVTTLDLDLQRAAEDALRGHKGAAVVLDPQTGDILALADAPAYDLNLMVGRLAPTTYHALKDSGALFDKPATSGQYPPGSVFKIVTAACALERGKVTPGEYFYCDGIYKGIHCWKHAGHGAVNLNRAVAESCNVAFMKMAERVGIDALADMGQRFGFGAPTGLGVLPEEAGNLPHPRTRAKRQRWQLGDTLQVGIGQSSLLITPLQAARLIAAIANGGKLVQPRLIKQIDTEIAPYPPTQPVGLHAKTLTHITAGLRAVVGEGTAHSLDPKLRIAGKTGTAQNPGGDDHAWFVGYAPAEAPTVAVAVLIVHGGHGGAVAAPVAASIIRTALQGPPSVTSGTPPSRAAGAPGPRPPSAAPRD